MKSNGHYKTGNGNAEAAALLTHPDDENPQLGVRRTIARRTDESARLQGLLDEATANAQAVSALIGALENANSIDDTMHAALDAVREAFGWAYGSFRQLDEGKQVLKTSIESGSMAEEFRNATVEAEFRQGEGLCGGAWKSRDLVFIPDFGAMTARIQEGGNCEAARDPIGDVLSDRGRRQGARDDGLLLAGSARPISAATGSVAQRRPPGVPRDSRPAERREDRDGIG